MLLKAEFDSNVGYLAPSIEAMLQAGEELVSSQKLQDLFYMVLMLGNFLNCVSLLNCILYLFCLLWSPGQKFIAQSRYKIRYVYYG